MSRKARRGPRGKDEKMERPHRGSGRLAGRVGRTERRMKGGRSEDQDQGKGNDTLAVVRFAFDGEVGRHAAPARCGLSSSSGADDWTRRRGDLTKGDGHSSRGPGIWLAWRAWYHGIMAHGSHGLPVPYFSPSYARVGKTHRRFRSAARGLHRAAWHSQTSSRGIHGSHGIHAGVEMMAIGPRCHDSSQSSPYSCPDPYPSTSSSTSSSSSTSTSCFARYVPP
ncbi:hypothetical protein B7494_g1019 [Chlorociboria aeruginascens]|nr:hypothetical protein B7494_g1019 [Chlorociboria aeruginascens]